MCMLKNHHEATKVDQGEAMEQVGKQNYQQNTMSDQQERCQQHYGEDSQTERHISIERSDKPYQLRRRSSVSYHLTGRMLKTLYRMHSIVSVHKYNM